MFALEVIFSHIWPNAILYRTINDFGMPFGGTQQKSAKTAKVGLVQDNYVLYVEGAFHATFWLLCCWFM